MTTTPSTALDPASIDTATLAWLAGAAANQHLLRRIRERGHPQLRTSHGYLFQHLLTGEPTVGELAVRLGMTPQGASKAVVELEALGYVERQADADDSRVRRVRLTGDGHRAVEAARQARAELETELREAADDGVVDAARSALVALLGHLGGTEAVRTRRVVPGD